MMGDWSDLEEATGPSTLWRPQKEYQLKPSLIAPEPIAIAIFDKDSPPAIPRTLAVCPICGAGLFIEDIDEWETESGRVTECGFHLNCETVPDMDSPSWHEWWDWHFSMPYVDWLPVEAFVYTWFDRRYRLRVDAAAKE